MAALGPRAIVVVSPHWMTRRPAVTARAQQEAWHDFGGFPPQLYALEYSPPGAPDLAERIRALIDGNIVPGLEEQASTVLDPRQPLDHGAWVPLMLMFPEATLPVVQVSLMPGLSPACQMAMGRTLAPLRDEGVLIIGSGSFTHNLRALMRGPGMAQHGVPVEPWVEAFREWMLDAMTEGIRSGDFATFCDYRAQAPHAAHAHPTDEHLMPLYVALGAAMGQPGQATPGGVQAQHVVDTVTYGSLAMDSFRFDGAGANVSTPEPPVRAAA
jgi:4,5-DOPA dioxygenase extradiol